MKIEEYELILMLEEYGEHTLLIDEDEYVRHETIIKDTNIVFVVKESVNLLFMSIRAVNEKYFIPEKLESAFRCVYHKQNIHHVRQLLNLLVLHKASLLQPW